MKVDNVFSEINVLEFAWVGVGAMAGKVLGGWGAKVVKVETIAAPCPLRSWDGPADSPAGSRCGRNCRWGRSPA